MIEGDNLPKYDIKLTNLHYAQKYYGKDETKSYEPISFYGRISGKQNIDSFSIKYQIDDNSPNAFGLGFWDKSWGPNSHKAIDGGESVQELGICNLSAGKHRLRIFVDEINGKKPEFTQQDTLSWEFIVIEKEIPRTKPLIEIHEESWCPFNKTGEAFEYYKKNHDDVSYVAIHSSDEFACDASKAYSIFGGDFVGYCNLNRFTYSNFKNLYLAIYSNDYDVKENFYFPSFATVNLSDVSLKGRTLNVKVSGECVEDYLEFLKNASLTVLLTESNVVGGKADAEEGYIENYVFDDVLRTSISPVWGTPISWDGNRYEIEYSYELDKSWVTDNMKIVAFISEQFNGSNFQDICIINCNDFSLKDAEIVECPTVSITIGKNGKTTFCGEKGLDFSGTDDVKAFIATGFDKNEGTIWMTRVKDVPAGVPVMIKGKANETYYIPVTDGGTSYYENMFVGNTTGETISIGETSDDGTLTNYYMSGGQFKSVKGSANIGNNKCYLQLPANFEEATTGEAYQVKIASSGKSSFAAPYDLDFTDLGDDLKAFTATGYDASTRTIWLTRVMKVQQGEGLFLKGTAGETYTIPSTGVQSAYVNMIVGNIDDEITISETSDDGKLTNFYLKGGTYMSVKGSATIGKNKSYLQLPTDMLAGARSEDALDNVENLGIPGTLSLTELETESMPIIFGSIGGDDDETTGIRTTDCTDDTDESRAAWYTLGGQRISQPTKKGIYIHKGRKVVVK